MACRHLERAMARLEARLHDEALPQKIRANLAGQLVILRVAVRLIEADFPDVPGNGQESE
jgi:hypothetical protein